MADYDIKLSLLKLSFNKAYWFVRMNLRKGKPLGRHKNELTIDLEEMVGRDIYIFRSFKMKFRRNILA